VYEDISFAADDLPGYAIRVFDLAMANPDLMRLLAWSSLEQTTGGPAERRTVHDVKLAELKEARDAGRVGTDFPADFLLTAILALATAWTAASPFGPSLDPDAAKRPAALRENIADAVRLISNGKTDGT